MKKQDLYQKLSETDKKLKEIGFSNEEIAFLKTKVSKHNLGLYLSYTEFDKELQENYFGFKEIEELGINVKSDLKNHLLIEGDNYYALKALKTSNVKADVIYIDPPYNTGKEFVYNDNFANGPKPVGADDPHKHSKWLSFMKKRLELAKELLSEGGVIFVSIDDNEQAYLKVQMDEIFGEDNFVANFVWLKGNAQNDALNAQKNHEYIVSYLKKQG
ncbi:MAG: DNA methyltransferase, partial [Mycoplasma sp.]